MKPMKESVNFTKLLLPKWYRDIPNDLFFVLMLTILLDLVVVVPFINNSIIRFSFSIIYILLVPGYVLTTVLFPRSPNPNKSQSPIHGGNDEDDNVVRFTSTGVSHAERFVLSIGFGAMIIPSLAYFVDLLTKLQTFPVILVVTVYMFITSFIANQRRKQLPKSERLIIQFPRPIIGIRPLRNGADKSDIVLNSLLVLSILLATFSIAFVFHFPKDVDTHSSISVLSGSSDKMLSAGNYPTNLTYGGSDSDQVYVRIENSEHQTINYTVIFLEQKLELGDENTSVTGENEVGRHRIKLDHNESHHKEYTLSPSYNNSTVRFVWLLFVDNVPDNPSQGNADYFSYLQITIPDS